MIGKHLGKTIDIHGGGQDLIFPHHENEIAQGTCANGALYCRTWVHNSFVTVDGQKMSKSQGNVMLVKNLLVEAPGEAIRLALLSTHYRNPLDWNESRLNQSRATLTRWYTSLLRAEGEALPDWSEIEPDGEVLAALRDDLNVSRALKRLHELCHSLEQAEEGEASKEKAQAFRASAGLLGLLQRPADLALQALRGRAYGNDKKDLPAERVAELIHERQEARRQRNFARADKLRDELDSAGIVVEDTEQGPRWHREFRKKADLT